MIREYVEGHKFNRHTKSILSLPPHKSMWFVKGVIRCDGQLKGFAAMGNTLGEAQRGFDTYLNPECICVYGSDVRKCPVHGKEYEYLMAYKEKLTKGIEG